MIETGTIVALAALTSALLPSPVTLATFKPWKSEDPLVRQTFWASILIGIFLLFYIASKGGKR